MPRRLIPAISLIAKAATQITHCGICGSDLHTLRSGWGETLYPCCVGHEIVGKAVRVGSKAEGGIKVGDRVGVGAQSASCLKPECEQCADNNENFCQIGRTDTYNSKYHNGTGKSYGGYADYWRGPSHFVFKIPDGLSSESAAPMLCGGITSASPLFRNGAGPDTRVGIIGVGGLGHYGILFAKALGCKKITAISRTATKKEDVLKMGATDFIATGEDKDWATKNSQSLDLIVSTVSSPKMPFQDYLKLLGVGGQLIQVGAPEDKIPPFNAFDILTRGLKVGGSAIGSPQEIRRMLQLAVDHKISSWTQTYPLKDVNTALKDFDAGKPRYRFVLVNEGNADA